MEGYINVFSFQKIMMVLIPERIAYNDIRQTYRNRWKGVPIGRTNRANYDLPLYLFFNLGDG